MRLSPRPFVLASTEHGTLIVNRFDYHQLPTGVTYGVGHQIFSRGAYDPQEISMVLSELHTIRQSRDDNRPIVALDCGANIGVHTIEMAKEMSEWGEVVAIEAQERLFYALCGNIAINNVFNARAILAAVTDYEAEMPVPQPDYNRPASFGSMELRRTPSTEYIGQSISYAESKMGSIQTITIDALVGPLVDHIDFIKLDIEGMEMSALAGAENALATYRPILLVEWIKNDREAMKSFLTGRNYDVTELGANILAKPRS